MASLNGDPAASAKVNGEVVPPVGAKVPDLNAVPGARFVLMPSLYGHDGFLKEEAQVAAIMSEFLSSLEPAR